MSTPVTQIFNRAFDTSQRVDAISLYPRGVGSVSNGSPVPFRYGDDFVAGTYIQHSSKNAPAGISNFTTATIDLTVPTFSTDLTTKSEFGGYLHSFIAYIKADKVSSTFKVYTSYSWKVRGTYVYDQNNNTVKMNAFTVPVVQFYSVPTTTNNPVNIIDPAFSFVAAGLPGAQSQGLNVFISDNKFLNFRYRKLQAHISKTYIMLF